MSNPCHTNDTRSYWNGSSKLLKRGFATGILLLLTAYYAFGVYWLSQVVAQKEQVAKGIVIGYALLPLLWPLFLFFLVELGRWYLLLSLASLAALVFSVFRVVQAKTRLGFLLPALAILLVFAEAFASCAIHIDRIPPGGL